MSFYHTLIVFALLYPLCQDLLCSIVWYDSNLVIISSTRIQIYCTTSKWILPSAVWSGIVYNTYLILSAVCLHIPVRKLFSWFSAGPPTRNTHYSTHSKKTILYLGVGTSYRVGDVCVNLKIDIIYYVNTFCRNTSSFSRQ